MGKTKRKTKRTAAVGDSVRRDRDWVRRHNQFFDLDYLIAEAKRVGRLAIKRRGFVPSRGIAKAVKNRRHGSMRSFIFEPWGTWERKFRPLELSAYKKSDKKLIDAAQTVLWNIRFLREAMKRGDARASGLRGIHLGWSMMWFNSVLQKIDPQGLKNLMRRMENLTTGNIHRQKKAERAGSRRRTLMSFAAESGEHDSDTAAAKALSKLYPQWGAWRSFWNTWKASKTTNQQT